MAHTTSRTASPRNKAVTPEPFRENPGSAMTAAPDGRRDQGHLGIDAHIDPHTAHLAGREATIAHEAAVFAAMEASFHHALIGRHFAHVFARDSALQARGSRPPRAPSVSPPRRRPVEMPPRRRVSAVDLDYLDERIDATLRRETLLTPTDLQLVSAVIAELRAARQDGEVEERGL